MLNPHANQGLASRQRRYGSHEERRLDAVVVERSRRQEEAERLARVGLSEIVISLDGEHESQHWSAGIYAILRRDRLAPPLQRNAYVLQYVHPDDQQRVFRSSSDALEHGRTVVMAYRIVCDDGSVVQVTECLAVVSASATERLLFSDLKEITPVMPATVPQSGAPEPLQESLAAAAHAAQAMPSLVATFDALREREQQRLAREMHDDFGQLLAAMKLDLCMLTEKLARGDTSGQAQIDNLKELVDSMISSTRRIIAELPPKAVDELGLFPALEQLAAGFRKRHALGLTLRLPSAPPRTTPDVDLAVYRVLQEALNNIARHAGATRVDIQITCSPTHLSMCIQDNGKGIRAADLGKSGSFGLQWMRERVLALAGSFELNQVGDGGTSIAISLPLRQPTAGPLA